MFCFVLFCLSFCDAFFFHIRLVQPSLSLTPMSSKSSKKSFAEALRLVAIKLASIKGTSLALQRRSELTPDPSPSLILPRLYLGGYWHAINEAQLTALGVTHILSIMEDPPSFVDFEDKNLGARLKTLHVPLRDSLTSDILQHLDQTTEYIRDVLNDPESVILVSKATAILL